MMETYVYVENLKVHSYIGVLPQERTVGNDYLVSVRVGYPWQNAMVTDDVADTLNYAELADIVGKVMSGQCNLLEYAVGKMERAIVKAFPRTTSLVIDVRKIAPPICQDTKGCGVVLEMKY